MSIVFFSLALLCVVGVAGILGFGVFSMTRGGAFNEKYGNTLMRARVGLQGLALVMLVLAYYASK